MKRLGLLSIIGCSVSGVAIAAGVDCSVIPTCAEMGFTKSVTDCDGKTLLRCPFDITNDNAVFCPDGQLCSDEYNLDACPANGDCEECGGKQKFNGCNNGYTLADGNVCCSDSYYNLDNKPANSKTEQCGNRYHFTGCSTGYTQDGTTTTCCSNRYYNLTSKPANATVEQCGNKYHFTGCSAGYTQDGSTTNCCSDEYYNLTAKPDNATFEQCGNKYHFVSCNDGYIEENGSCVFPSKTCAVTDLLYNDLKCYETPPANKTPIAVVFDTSNRMAVAIEESWYIKWGLGYEIVPGAWSTNGKTNTQAIVNTYGDSSDYAAGYCYNLTSGGVSKGSWFLPSMDELYRLKKNNMISQISSIMDSYHGISYICMISSGGLLTSNQEDEYLAYGLSGCDYYNTSETTVDKQSTSYVAAKCFINY